MNPELVKLMQSHFDNPTVDILTPEPAARRADTTKRFLNYLIDVIVFYLIIFFVSMILAYESETFAETVSNDDSAFSLLDRLISLVLFGLYMSIVEAVFKGKTIGKMITKTRAVNLDGSEISVKTAFARGFSKAVPFCAFSAFGSPSNPWQDKWTDTMVIEDSKVFG